MLRQKELKITPVVRFKQKKKTFYGFSNEGLSTILKTEDILMLGPGSCIIIPIELL